MQFVRHGPDIPERLLQLHEDGHVVFFCGAGISYPAGLPGFKGLVKALHSLVGEPPDAVEREMISKGQFDLAIGHYENRIQGGRKSVRQQIPVALAPDIGRVRALTTHFALLELGQSSGGLRLVTTNFDTLFELAAKQYCVAGLTVYPDPPARTRWNGLVYLHGRMPEAPSGDDLERLVLSDGDFGQAYLTQGWAARFVATLFRDFTLCFVGYSIDDPVLRYMTAAHSLDSHGQEMFALAPFSNGSAHEAATAWQAKNVTPILYDGVASHRNLHRTLYAWASIYRNGVRGKERLVSRYAQKKTGTVSKQDAFVGRMLWALSDPGGLPAKRFAELDPVPSLDWLEPLSQDLYRHADLGRFGVPGQSAVDEALAFSLTCRPAPYPLAPWMAMADSGNRARGWDDVMHHLARWLTRHLDDPKLLLWLVKRGGQLHDELIWLIERRLEELAKLEHDGDGDAAELARIRENAPNAIPRPAMRTLWRVLLNGRVKSGARGLDLYRWRGYFDRDGLTASVRLALREVLTPCVSLREPFRWESDLEEIDAPDQIKDLVEWEIVLASQHVHSGLRHMPKDEGWTAALPDLLNDFSALLRDALDLMSELGGVDSRHDRTYYHQPSISEHPQNKNYHDWTALIELTRDAWLATAAQRPEQARIAAEAWAHAPYPVFRRLAFFAAAQGEVVPARMALDFLLKDDHWWLWSVETQRETMRLLVALAPRIDEAMLAEVEQAILSGPPREHIGNDDWTRRVDRNIWLRLAKMAQAGAALGANGNARLAALAAQYPEWQLTVDERDEFPLWMEGGWVGDRDPWKPFVPVPRTPHGVLDYLLAHPVLGASEQDDWRQRCSDSFQATAYALCKLAQQDNWPVERWRDGLQAWSEETLRDRSWRYMAPVLASAPVELIQALNHSVSWWLQSIAKTFESHEVHFLALAGRILELNFEPEDGGGDPVSCAINHPVGHVTKALLDWWYRQGLEDGQELPEAIKPVFSELCKTGIDKFKYGRFWLAVHVITLFRVDGKWAKQHLLPFFDWRRSETEARAAWEGFLGSPRLYRPLMEELKPAFLETANHYTQLGEHSGQYASLLTFAALDPGDTFTTSELASAVRALPSEGLREAGEALTRALEGAGDQREDYWKNRIQPFWERIWPKSNDRAADTNAESLARLCIAAGDKFQAAIAQVSNWLRVVEYPYYVIHPLHESGLCVRYPESALQLLDAILADQPGWLPPELRQCLNAIAQAAPNLRQDRRFMRVDELARR
jgi:hypothetical protein